MITLCTKNKTTSSDDEDDNKQRDISHLQESKRASKMQFVQNHVSWVLLLLSLCQVGCLSIAKFNKRSTNIQTIPLSSKTYFVDCSYTLCMFEKKQGVEKRRTYYQNVNNCLKKRKSKYRYKKGIKRKKQNNKTSTSATFLVKKVQKILKTNWKKTITQQFQKTRPNQKGSVQIQRIVPNNRATKGMSWYPKKT